MCSVEWAPSYPAHYSMTHFYHLFPQPPCSVHCWPVYLKPDNYQTQSRCIGNKKVSCHCRSKPRSLSRPACSLVSIPVEHVTNCSGRLQVHLCNSHPACTVKNLDSSAGIVTTLGAVTTALRPTRETQHGGQYCQEYSDWCVKLTTLPCTTEG
jgi:hypothetical protein